MLPSFSSRPRAVLITSSIFKQSVLLCSKVARMSIKPASLLPGDRLFRFFSSLNAERALELNGNISHQDECTPLKIADDRQYEEYRDRAPEVDLEKDRYPESNIVDDVDIIATPMWDDRDPLAKDAVRLIISEPLLDKSPEPHYQYIGDFYLSCRAGEFLTHDSWLDLPRNIQDKLLLQLLEHHHFRAGTDLVWESIPAELNIRVVDELCRTSCPTILFQLYSPQKLIFRSAGVSACTTDTVRATMFTRSQLICSESEEYEDPSLQSNPAVEEAIIRLRRHKNRPPRTSTFSFFDNILSPEKKPKAEGDWAWGDTWIRVLLNDSPWPRDLPLDFAELESDLDLECIPSRLSSINFTALYVNWLNQVSNVRRIRFGTLLQLESNSRTEEGIVRYKMLLILTGQVDIDWGTIHSIPSILLPPFSFI